MAEIGVADDVAADAEIAENGDGLELAATSGWGDSHMPQLVAWVLHEVHPRQGPC